MKRILIVFLNMRVGVMEENQHLMFCSNWIDQLEEPIKQCRVLLQQFSLQGKKMALSLNKKIHSSTENIDSFSFLKSDFFNKSFEHLFKLYSRLIAMEYAIEMVDFSFSFKREKLWSVT